MVEVPVGEDHHPHIHGHHSSQPVTHPGTVGTANPLLKVLSPNLAGELPDDGTPLKEDHGAHPPQLAGGDTSRTIHPTLSGEHRDLPEDNGEVPPRPTTAISSENFPSGRIGPSSHTRSPGK